MSACLSLNPHDCFIFPFLLRQVFQVLSAITALCLQLQALCSSHACISLYSGVKGFQHKQVCYRFLFFFFKSPIHIESVANVILSSGMCEGHTNCCSDPYSATDGRPFSYDSSQHFKCSNFYSALFLSLETDLNQQSHKRTILLWQRSTNEELTFIFIINK